MESVKDLHEKVNSTSRKSEKHLHEKVKNGERITIDSEKDYSETYSENPLTPVQEKTVEAEVGKPKSKAKAGLKQTEYPAPLDTEKFREVWERFNRFRTELRKPVLPTSEVSLLAKLARDATDAEVAAAMVEQSIANGWQGIFPLKTNFTNGNTNGHANGKAHHAGGQGAQGSNAGSAGGTAPKPAKFDDDLLWLTKHHAGNSGDVGSADDAGRGAGEGDGNGYAAYETMQP